MPFIGLFCYGSAAGLYRRFRISLQWDLLADVARMGSRENRNGRNRPAAALNGHRAFEYVAGKNELGWFLPRLSSTLSTGSLSFPARGSAFVEPKAVMLANITHLAVKIFGILRQSLSIFGKLRHSLAISVKLLILHGLMSVVRCRMIGRESALRPQQTSLQEPA